MKEMRGWKVITKNRFSICASKWGREYRKWKVKYPLNKMAIPIEGSKLMFFKSKKNAEDFMKKTWARDGVIVPCIGYGVKKAEHICWDTRSIGDFWKVFNAGQDLTQFDIDDFLPEGTYFADTIKCLE